MMSKTTQREARNFRPEFIMPVIPGVLTCVGLLAAIYATATEMLPVQAKIFMVLWLACRSLALSCSRSGASRQVFSPGCWRCCSAGASPGSTASMS